MRMARESSSPMKCKCKRYSDASTSYSTTRPWRDVLKERQYLMRRDGGCELRKASLRLPRSPRRGTYLRASSTPARHPPRLISHHAAKVRKIAGFWTVQEADSSSSKGNEQQKLPFSSISVADKPEYPSSTVLRRAHKRHLPSLDHRKTGGEFGYTGVHSTSSSPVSSSLGPKYKRMQRLLGKQQIVVTIETHLRRRRQLPQSLSTGNAFVSNLKRWRDLNADYDRCGTISEGRSAVTESPDVQSADVPCDATRDVPAEAPAQKAMVIKMMQRDAVSLATGEASGTSLPVDELPVPRKTAKNENEDTKPTESAGGRGTIKAGDKTAHYAVKTRTRWVSTEAAHAAQWMCEGGTSSVSTEIAGSNTEARAIWMTCSGVGCVRSKTSPASSTPSESTPVLSAEKPRLHATKPLQPAAHFAKRPFAEVLASVGMTSTSKDQTAGVQGTAKALDLPGPRNALQSSSQSAIKAQNINKAAIESSSKVAFGTNSTTAAMSGHITETSSSVGSTVLMPGVKTAVSPKAVKTTSTERDVTSREAPRALLALWDADEGSVPPSGSMSLSFVSSNASCKAMRERTDTIYLPRLQRCAMAATRETSAESIACRMSLPHLKCSASPLTEYAADTGSGRSFWLALAWADSKPLPGHGSPLDRGH